MAMLASTWKAAFPAVESVYPLLASGMSAEDAVERVTCFVEDDPDAHTVGSNAFPTRDGLVELDAAFMEGKNRTMGGVCCVRDFKNPIKLARLVMEKTPHSLLAGEGATRFGERMGLERTCMSGEFSRAEYEKFLSRQTVEPGCDTVGTIALDRRGHFALAMSTSGLSFRMPGRVSDSAIPGCGYFCDDLIGAAVCTGVGEDIMRGALAARAIDYLMMGESVENAARRVVADVSRRLAQSGIGNVALIVADATGRFAGAANHDGFFISGAGEGIEPRVIAVEKV